MPMPSHPVTTLTREYAAGAASVLAGLASVLTLGILAYAALGSQAATIGIPAALIATVFGGSLFAVIARGPMPAGGPSSAPTLMLAALVAGVVADPGFDRGRANDVAALLALTAGSVVGMGLLQIAIALSGLMRVSRFVPQPVLAGFMNGVAVVFVLSQVPALFGWTSGLWAAQGLHALAAIEPATLAIGMATVVAVWAWPRLSAQDWMPGVTRFMPPSFAGLWLGCALYAAVAWLAPSAALGGMIGEVPRALPTIDRLVPWFGGDVSGLLRRHALTAATTAALMAMIGTLDIVLNGLALDQALRSRTEPRHELFALGAANILSGVFGGLPLLLVRARALATWRAGGRRRVSLLFANTLFAVLALVGTPLLALLPETVLAGIMVMVGLLLFDAWSLRLVGAWIRGRRSAEARHNLVLVGVVCGVSVVFGFALGVAVGAVLAVVVFIRSMNRSLVRARRSAVEQPSRRIYSEAHETVLRAQRPSIAILELEGALFFGSADRLTREVDALAGKCLAIVMDFRRVNLIDASGAVVLSQIHDRLQERGVALRLAGLVPGDRHGHALREFAGEALPTSAWHPDVDRAVEAAEIDALARVASQSVDEAVPLSRSALAIGLDTGQCALLAGYLETCTFRAGERLFSQGDPGDRLYVLTVGSISVMGHVASTGSRRRFVTCSPGMMLGEVAMLDGRGRSGEAVADSHSETRVLTKASLQRLGAEHPALCALVYRNIARHLADRLRTASIVHGAGED